VNHINVEEVMNELDAMMGMVPLNSFTTLVLFDTGASHSFISRTFANKNEFPTETIGKTIKVSSPGGELLVNAGCRQLILEIGKYKFPTHLVVLDSQGLDVRDFYFHALRSLVVLSFPQLLSFSSVLSKPLSKTVTSAGTASCPMGQQL
jgi:hypothetical protein